jgi:beta-phosphoglucomutase
MKKVVLFDMDGVIVNTEGKHYLAWKKAFELEEVLLTKSVYKVNVQSQGREKGINNMVPNCTIETKNRISDNKSRFYEELINEGIEVYSDAFVLIKALAKTDIILGVVSSSSYASTIIDKINLTGYFSLIIAGTSELHINNKPSPDIYNLAIEKLGVKKEEVLIIEDSISGIQSGLQAGCIVVGVKREKLSITSKHLVLVKALDYNLISQLLN